MNSSVWGITLAWSIGGGQRRWFQVGLLWSSVRCVHSFRETFPSGIVGSLGWSIFPQLLSCVPLSPWIALPHFPDFLSFPPEEVSLHTMPLFQPCADSLVLSSWKQEKMFLLWEEKSHQILHFIYDKSGRMRSDFVTAPHLYMKTKFTTVLFSRSVASFAWKGFAFTCDSGFEAIKRQI